MWGHRACCPLCSRGCAPSSNTRSRCGVTCWNLLLLGRNWAEESWHRAGTELAQALREGTCSGGS